MLSRAGDRLSLRWQLLRTRPVEFPVAADPETLRQEELIKAWALRYLAAPHPQLGRSGAVCPFVKPSIELDRFMVSFQPTSAHSSYRELRAVVLAAAHWFVRHQPREEPKSTFASMLLAFPGLTPDQYGWLDRAHEQLKVHLVDKLEVMSTPFHPESVKPSATNPSFAVFRGPHALIAMRHLDVRDIRFLDWNERGFRRYHARFAPRFARGEVSDEFGDVSRFETACRRFGLPQRAAG